MRALDSEGNNRLVSVVVPAHNEETTVAVFVERTAKAFAQIGRPWELVYVDDGSTDQTAARCRPPPRLSRASGWCASAATWV